MQLKRQCTGDGPLGEILVIGHGPHHDDVIAGKPFASPAGRILRKFCQELGLEKVRFENVVEYPIQGSALYLDHARQLPTPELQEWRRDLRRRIKSVDPKVIVACGDTALKALTDHTSVARTHCYVLSNPELGNVPVIPAFHPAYIMKQRSNYYWLKFALAKAKEILTGKRDNEVSFDISNNVDNAIAALETIKNNKTETSIDIESIKGKLIVTCIGFSVGPDKAIAISNIGHDKPDSSQWNYFISMLRSVLEDPEIVKIGQNFMFDALMLWKIFDIKTKGPVWDTMHCHNILYNELKNSLEEQGRLYFYHEPWKGHWNSTGERLRLYNARDVTSTHRIKDAQEEKLKTLDLYSYFTNGPQQVWQPSFDLASRGILVDVEKREKLLIEATGILEQPLFEVRDWAKPYLSPGEKKKKKRDNVNDKQLTMSQEHCEWLQVLVDKKSKRPEINDFLKKLGIPEKEYKEYYLAKTKDEKHGLIPNTLYKKAYREEIELYSREFNPASPSQVMSVLVNAEVKIPKSKQQHTKKWAESTNEKALKKILGRKAERTEVKDFIANMLKLRAGNKLITSYLKADLDADNRWRCSYNVEGTETGRSSTRKTPWDTGGNNQNIPRGAWQGIKFKSAFIADKGYTMFQSDQGQAEARVVAYLARCQRLIELFDKNEDIHVYAINSILGEDIREKPKKEYNYLRQTGKFINHGGNYDMGAVTLSEQAMQQGVDIPVNKAEYFLKKRREVFPEIYIWHQMVQEQLHKTRTLMTPFGRRRLFMGKIDNNTYREAYAHIPQSTIPHITNLMWLWVERQNMDYVEVLQMGHDALLMQVKSDKLDEFIKSFLRQTKTINFNVNNYNVIIPWDAQIGTNWGQLKDWKGK